MPNSATISITHRGSSPARVRTAAAPQAAIVSSSGGSDATQYQPLSPVRIPRSKSLSVIDVPWIKPGRSAATKLTRKHTVTIASEMATTPRRSAACGLRGTSATQIKNAAAVRLASQA